MYALAVQQEIDPYELADDILVPLQVTNSFGGGDRPDRGTELTIEGAEVSAVRREAGALEVRVFNPTDSGRRLSPCPVARVGWSTCEVCPVSPFEGSFPYVPTGSPPLGWTPAEPPERWS